MPLLRRGLAPLLLAALALNVLGRALAQPREGRRGDFSNTILALTFTPSGDELVLLERDVDGHGHDPGVIGVWPRSGTVAAVAYVDSREPSDVAVSPKGDVLAVAHDFGEINLFSLSRREMIGEAIHGGGWEIGSNFGGPRWVEFSPSGQRLAWSSLRATLNAADVSGKRLIRPIVHEERFGWEDWPAHAIRVLGFTSEDEIAYVASVGVGIWSIEKHATVANLPPVKPGWSGDALSPRGTLWVNYYKVRESWTGATFVAPIRRVPSLEKVGEAAIDDEAIVAFSPDDELIAIVGVGGVKIQEVKTGKAIAHFKLPLAKEREYRGPHLVEFSPKRDELAVARGATVWVFPFERK